MELEKLAASSPCYRRALQTLQDDLEKERVQWKVPVYSQQSEGSDAMSLRDRQSAVLWMERQCYRFRFHADTFCLSVTLLDAFLCMVRAKARYITCVALTALYLAAKLCEEDELVPAITYVVEKVGPGCSVSDVLRMERIVLDKFHWQIRLVTPLNFLHSLHCLLVAACPDLIQQQPRLSPHRQLSGLTDRLLELITDTRLVDVRPSCLAAALICTELERCAVMARPFIEAAQKLIQVSAGDLRSACDRIWSVLSAGLGSVLVPPRPVLSAAKRPRQRGDSRSFSRPAKRKLVSGVTEDQDDIVHDIRNLYSQDQELEMKSQGQPARPGGDKLNYVPKSPEFPELVHGVPAETPSPIAQACSLISKAARRSYAEVLRLHLPTASVTAVGV